MQEKNLEECRKCIVPENVKAKRQWVKVRTHNFTVHSIKESEKVAIVATIFFTKSPVKLLKEQRSCETN